MKGAAKFRFVESSSDINTPDNRVENFESCFNFIFDGIVVIRIFIEVESR